MSVACGCGGGGVGPLGGGLEETEAGSEPPSVVAADFGREVGLRQSDVPYLEAQPAETGEEDNSRWDREFERCLADRGAAPEPPLATVESPTFQSHSPGAFISVQSTVEVAASAAIARQALDLGASPRAKSCLSRFIPRALREQGSVEVEIHGIRVRRLASPAPDLGRVIGYRISMSIGASGATPPQTVAYRPAAESPPGPRVPFHVDLLALDVGPAEISLLASGAPTPVSRGLEASLLRTMRERALAHGP